MLTISGPNAEAFIAMQLPLIAATVDGLTLFGAVSVASMLLFYALESRSRSYILAFAGACLASSLYGFLQGAWPFGVIEFIWSGVALRRWQSNKPA